MVRNPLPDHIKVTVFMDGLKVGPSRTQLFRVHANTMEEAIQIALQEEYSHQQTHPIRILIDSGASANFARDQTVARGGDKYADALRENEGRGQISVRLADGTVANVPGVRKDLAVKFEDFDSTESFLILDLDKYNLILGMPWLEKHEPWIYWCGKAIGAIRPAVSDKAMVSNVPTSVRDWGARDDRQGANAPEEVLGVADSVEGVAMGLATGHKTKTHCRSFGIATTASHNPEGRRAVWASAMAVPDDTDQAGNTDPHAAESTEDDAEGASGVGNIVPHEVEETEKKNESAACVSSVDNRVPRGVKKTSTRAGMTLSTSRADNKAPHSESETQPARPVEEQYQIFDGVSERQVTAGAVLLEALPDVSALLNLEEIFMKDFVAKCEGIDVFFAEKAKSVMLRNRNNATVPTQTPIPRKDVLLNNMSGCTLYSSPNVVDGYYQILMRESDIPLTAVSTPSGILWKWLVMPQGLSNAPATFHRLITQLFRPLQGQTAMEVHLKHLRRVFEVMRANKLYANIDNEADWKFPGFDPVMTIASKTYAPIQGSSRS
ncbi:Putative Polyprotein [Phytophthora palmivora]|uniref:Polyprotein n=1 Tax=Phytophthora palmivora TaxID=4796 RepID=A0A2P4YV90_9STRA|nr:Putative Polyprotein [Phytophthora palmivora]